MAFLVRYSGPDLGEWEEATYLPQEFYELIFRQFARGDANHPHLTKVSQLRYKSPTLHLDTNEVSALLKELKTLDDSLPGVLDLKAAASTAVDQNYGLKFSGDMYPEL